MASNKDRYNKSRRDRLRRAGYCINGKSHGKPKKGTKCKRCVEVHSGKASSLKQKRAQARKEGLCGTCCSRRPSEGFRTCDGCLSNTRESHQRMKLAAAYCTKCQAAGFHRPDCPSRGSLYWTLLGVR